MLVRPGRRFGAVIQYKAKSRFGQLIGS